MLPEIGRRVVYSCPFIPAEWIAAHGLQPSRIMPSSQGLGSTIGIGAGVCTFARAFINSVLADPNAAGIVVTTLCDQMRRGAEVIAREVDRPVFLMNVPSTWQTANAQRLYVSELKRFGTFLIGLGGEAPSPDSLSDLMKRYDTARSAVRAARGGLSAREYSETIARFHLDGTVPLSGSIGADIPHGVPLALVGGPLMSDHLELFDAIERSGGYVALDATETGERSLPASFDRRRLADEPLQVLADAYFGHIPDASRRPNSELYRWLKSELGARGIRGVIYIRHIWCDIWHAEARRMKDWLGLPFFDLDITEDANDEGRRLTRFEAFMEMLR